MSDFCGGSRIFKGQVTIFKKGHKIFKKAHNFCEGAQNMRVSSHTLMIDKGRHFKPPITRTDRKCPTCKTHIEDECHFLIACPLYESERRKRFHIVQTNSSLFDEIPTDKQKFIFLRTNEDPYAISNLATFVCNAFKLRSTRLKTN